MKTDHEYFHTQLLLDQALTSARLQASERATREHQATLDVVESAIEQQLRSRAYSIERALDRMAAGQYGLCQTCWQPIHLERLLAMPHVALCVACQRSLERRVLGARQKQGHR